MKNKVSPPFKAPSSTSSTARASAARARSSTWAWAHHRKSGAVRLQRRRSIGQGSNNAREFLRENTDTAVERSRNRCPQEAVGTSPQQRRSRSPSKPRSAWPDPSRRSRKTPVTNRQAAARAQGARPTASLNSSARRRLRRELLDQRRDGGRPPVAVDFSSPYELEAETSAMRAPPSRARAGAAERYGTRRRTGSIAPAHPLTLDQHRPSKRRSRPGRVGRICGKRARAVWAGRRRPARRAAGRAAARFLGRHFPTGHPGSHPDREPGACCAAARRLRTRPRLLRACGQPALPRSPGGPAPSGTCRRAALRHDASPDDLSPDPRSPPMKIHEYQGKGTCARTACPSRGYPRSPCARAEEAAQVAGAACGWSGAQIHAGGRGKAAASLARSMGEVAKLARKILGMQLITHQTGPEGQRCAACTSRKARHQEGVLRLRVTDRATQKVAFMASSEGGMDIEEVAHKTPEKILKVHVDPVGSHRRAGRNSPRPRRAQAPPRRWTCSRTALQGVTWRPTPAGRDQPARRTKDGGESRWTRS